MKYSALMVETKVDTKVMVITFDRPAEKNAINGQMLQEIHQALDEAEKNPEIRTILLQGNDQFFCTGMDFKEALSAGDEKEFAAMYASTLKRLTMIGKIIVSICEGKVMAGGVGFAAASDVVIAHPSAIFTLSEIIWGLLPANVMPYLIRRAGFQPAYMMTLTTAKISAKEAKEFHLVDMVSDEPHQYFDKLNQRLSVIHPETITKMKSYFRKMWIINEDMEQLAIKTLTELKMDPRVQQNIKNYVEKGQFPWETV